jgi:hypothetical protein
MSDSTNTYRVLKIPDTILTAMRRARDQIKTTNVDFLATSVDNYLPGLVAELQRLGFTACDESARAARLPFSDEHATLGQLKEASEVVGLPVTKLLELCLIARLRCPQEPKRRRSRRSKSVKSARTQSRRPRRRRQANSKEGE